MNVLLAKKQSTVVVMVMIVCVGQETEYSGCNGNDSVCWPRNRVQWL